MNSKTSLFLFAISQCLAQGPSIGLTQIVTGVPSPTAITHAGDDSNRLFILAQGGQILILKGGVLLGSPFLDIRNRVLFGGERGLLGVAFPPEFAQKNYFYVYYTSQSGDNVLARYGVTDDPDIADPASETILLTLPHQSFSNHNGGQIAFGPLDGYLYLGLGDGGGGGDPLGNAQNTTSLLGKLLRIDVESGTDPYAIPADNPFVSDPQSSPEIWAYGLRNPWRFSFDRETGDLYIADVGQNKYEEVDVQPASSTGGENYGWNQMEGTHCYPVDDGLCNTDGLVLPAIDYDHLSGDCAIIGGYVYRGAQYPSLQGTYFYGDYCSGRIWGMTFDGASWHSTLLLRAGFQISSFGEDQEGNLYVAALNTGEIYCVTEQ